MRIDPTNQRQYDIWDGTDGAYWAANAERFERSLAQYDDALFAAAAVKPADRVLDVGCGTGSTTRIAASAASSGTATGVDLSAAMLDVARRRAAGEGLTNVTFTQADAQVQPFGAAAFDLALSRTTAMFFGDPAAAFANLARALGRSGRLVLLVWQGLHQQEWMLEIRTALAAGRDLPVPPELVLASQVTHGATRGWLGRTFRDLDTADMDAEIGRLRQAISRWSRATAFEIELLRSELRQQIAAIPQRHAA